MHVQDPKYVARGVHDEQGGDGAVWSVHQTEGLGRECIRADGARSVGHDVGDALGQQCNSISGMARLTSRQGHLRRSGSERDRDLCGGSSVRIEEFASLKHRMHYNRQFARHGHGSSFEADPLSELQTPRAQSAVG